MQTYVYGRNISPVMKRMTLHAARTAKGWTQEQLEAASGVDQRNISKIERGDITDPRASTVEALERALGVRRGTLTFGDQPSSGAAA